MKIFYITIGILSLALGSLGIFLPVLPTTPFLLLAAFCFTKSSKRLHNWLTQTELYKKHLNSFIQNRSMTLKTKLGILIPASLMLIVAMILIGNTIMRFVILGLIAFKYFYFFFCIKTISEKLAE